MTKWPSSLAFHIGLPQNLFFKIFCGSLNPLARMVAGRYRRSTNHYHKQKTAAGQDATTLWSRTASPQTKHKAIWVKLKPQVYFVAAPFSAKSFFKIFCGRYNHLARMAAGRYRLSTNHYHKQKTAAGQNVLRRFLVEATGFEPTTLWSRTIRATNCATPRRYRLIIFLFNFSVK